MSPQQIFVEPKIAFEVNESDFYRLLGYPVGVKPDAETIERIISAKKWYSQNGKPFIATKRHPISKSDYDKLHVNGSVLTSRTLVQKLQEVGANDIIVAILSAGIEIDNFISTLWKTHRPDEAYVMDRLASSITETLVNLTRRKICDQISSKNETVIPHYSPGYDGWALQDQVALFSLLQDHQPGRALPINVLTSGGLTIRSAILTLYGITKRLDLVNNNEKRCPCTTCQCSPCNFRRMPYQGPFDI